MTLAFLVRASFFKNPLRGAPPSPVFTQGRQDLWGKALGSESVTRAFLLAEQKVDCDRGR